MEQPQVIRNPSADVRSRHDVCDDTYFNQTGYFEYYVPSSKQGVAVAESLYGYPIDVDKVWKHREALQNEL